MVLVFFARLLFFSYFFVEFPVVGAVGAEGDAGVGVFDGDVVVGGAVGGDLKQIGNPKVGVVLFYFQEQLEGELVGGDVAGDGEELTGVRVEGVEDDSVEAEGEL